MSAGGGESDVIESESRDLQQHVTSSLAVDGGTASFRDGPAADDDRTTRNVDGKGKLVKVVNLYSASSRACARL